VAVAHVSSDTLTGDPYTTLLDSTREILHAGKASFLPVYAPRGRCKVFGEVSHVPQEIAKRPI
jgi:hypothetical protein